MQRGVNTGGSLSLSLSLSAPWVKWRDTRLVRLLFISRLLLLFKLLFWNIPLSRQMLCKNPQAKATMVSPPGP